ncbi:MAG: glycosyltransferase [Deltaproteobacteria bacterium]|nr:glycosyltransferase [Deltaproteobacteria bacterium]
MRILQVVGGLAEGWGSPSKVVRELSGALAQRGHDVEIRTTDVAPAGARLDVPLDRPVRDEQGFAIRFYRCDRPHPPYPSLRLLRAIWRDAEAWDVVHVHGLFSIPTSMTLVALRTKATTPYVVRTCGMLDPYSLSQRRRLKTAYFRTLERSNLNGAARIHVSTPLEQQAVQALELTPPICVIPQGVEPPAKAVGATPIRPYVLFLSRIARKKGLELLVRAFDRLAAERPALDLVIAGPDERGHRATIEGLAQRLGLTHRVRFPGFVRGQQKADLLGHAAAFALSSYDENFGIVVVEAVQAGTPVVVSNKLGLAATVAEHGAGEVVGLDVESIADGLRTVLSRGKQHYRAGLTAMGQSFEWGLAAERVAQMYRRVVAEHSARR